MGNYIIANTTKTEQPERTFIDPDWEEIEEPEIIESVILNNGTSVEKQSDGQIFISHPTGVPPETLAALGLTSLASSLEKAKARSATHSAPEHADQPPPSKTQEPTQRTDPPHAPPHGTPCTE